MSVSPFERTNIVVLPPTQARGTFAVLRVCTVLNVCAICRDDAAVDFTPPRAVQRPADGDDKDTDIDYQLSQDGLAASWAPFVDDESSVTSYSCCASSARNDGDDSCDVSPWHNVGLVETCLLTGLHLAPGARYFGMMV
jgi:hypothetical protein